MSAENKYIPRYIKDVPLFLQTDKEKDSDYLSHHRNGTDQSNAEPKIGQGIHDTFQQLEKPVVKSKFKKGGLKKGCNICGGLDHKKEECLERPGQVHKGIRNDEVDYDTKRDRWFGYDVNEYREHLASWEQKVERRSENARHYDTDEEIELKELGLWEDYTSENNIKVEGEKTVRLREDKAVYLKDYKSDEIKYDPKSRMIRDETTGYYNENNQFVRHKTGEALKFEQFEKRAAWEGQNSKDGTIDVNIPTLFDKKLKRLTKEQEDKSKQIKDALFSKYNSTTTTTGNNEIKDGDQTSEQANLDYTEMAQHDSSNNTSLSKYDEDVLVNGHTSVWGSWYSLGGKWGYACCKQTDRDKVCML